MTFRRLLTITLALFVLAAVGMVAYPYARYRSVAGVGYRGFEDRWREPGPRNTAYPSLVAWILEGPEARFETVDDDRGITSRELGPNGVVREVMIERDGSYTTAHYGPDGVFLRGARRDPESVWDAQQLTESEARALFGRYLEPDGMPWPWWTRLPFFAGHLRGE